MFSNIRLTQFIASRFLILVSFVYLFPIGAQAQHSVAREWNEVLLEAIRNDFARPTVHARNLFHTSMLVYDAWAVYEPGAETYFLGKTVRGFTCPYSPVATPSNIKAAQEEAMSYAAYRLMKFRFRNSPGASVSLALMDTVFIRMGYNPFFNSINYAQDGPAALGNYMASQMFLYGFQDGARESSDYRNAYYRPRNSNLSPVMPGNLFAIDPNNWQPLSLSVFVDQSGNPIPGGAPEFLSPEWGNVDPFALADSQKTTYTRGGNTYQVYEDPGPPALLDSMGVPNTSGDYQWGHTLVGIWASHLDPNDTTMWDISPNSIGNLQNYPTTLAGLRNFYNLYDGGDNSTGRPLNPKTGSAYTPQIVSRGDYTRVLAEFWADGPDSETPPGHWFTILNYVHDHPQFERRWMGEGPLVDDLEWDVKAYFTLGGAVHDAAIAAWSIKGWYDYLRPVSALRYMSDRGQSTDTSLANYSPYGIPLHPGFIEVIQLGDPLAGTGNQNLGKIKIRSWRGPSYINDPTVNYAGVDWIPLAEWWPYQRPTFVTPPFAGYVSGHSTFSRAAAEVLTLITGDEYFPGGMAEFRAAKDSFLVFEKGPNNEVILQWATYRDASDQSSLSRIWGGIHPPVDDVPGRLIGRKIGPQAVDFAQTYFDPNAKSDVVSVSTNVDTIADQQVGTASFTMQIVYERDMDTTTQPSILFPAENPEANTLTLNTDSSYWVNAYTFLAAYDVADSSEVINDIDIRIEAGLDKSGNLQETYSIEDVFSIDTENPDALSLVANMLTLSDSDTGQVAFQLNLVFSEKMDTTVSPLVTYPVENPLSKSLTINTLNTFWKDSTAFQISYNLADSSETLADIDIRILNAQDLAGNALAEAEFVDFFSIDTENPSVDTLPVNIAIISDNDTGSAAFRVRVVYSEEMDTTTNPAIQFPKQNPLTQSLRSNSDSTMWLSTTVYEAVYDVLDANETLDSIDVEIAGAADALGNVMEVYPVTNGFKIDTENPGIIRFTPDVSVIADANAGIGTFRVSILFTEDMDTLQVPSITFPDEDPLAQSLSLNADSSKWLNSNTFEAVYNVLDANETLADIDVQAQGGKDAAGNESEPFENIDLFHIDTENPSVVLSYSNINTVTNAHIGIATFELLYIFSEKMDQNQTPATGFPVEDPFASALVYNADSSEWINDFTYVTRYDVVYSVDTLLNIDTDLSLAADVARNTQIQYMESDVFNINIADTTTVGILPLADDYTTIKAYPNPIERGETLIVEPGFWEPNLRWEIYNTNGQKLAGQSTMLATDQKRFNINPGVLAPGIYVLRVSGLRHQGVVRVVVRE